MRIRILCVGKVKEPFYRQAAAEYSKRIGRYARVDIVEVPDEKTPEHASAGMNKAIRVKEGERLLRQIGERDYTIALDMHGRELDSPALADHLQEIMNRGVSRISFVIGGSLGLDAGVTKRADEVLSFSKLTFPHQLMRVILLEQIYRSFRIMNHEPYHK